MNPTLQCLECGAPLTAADAGGLCPKCLLRLGLVSQLASGTLPATAAGLTSEGMVLEPFDFGNYRILRLLGKGGMGAVYEAEQRETGRRVALKVLGHTLDTPEMRQRFLREGQLAAAVRHPKVVAVFATEEVEGAPVIAMELVTDGTLKDRVKRHGPMRVADAVDATLDIIDGLEAAHAGGVLHRDVKPVNCFVEPDGAVKVGDFGLSISTLAKAEAQLTQSGAILGTPAFASPEQLRAHEIDLRSDIYSVGATLYYLLTGKPTHDAETLVALIAAVLEQTPAEPCALRPELPRDLSQIVMRCLAKSAGARFQTYAELRATLLPFSSAAPVPAPLGLRFIAGYIDIHVALLPGLVMIAATGADPDALFLSERSLATALGLAAFIAWEMIYIGIAEGLWGAALGKALCGLRVARPTGGRPGVLRGLARGAFTSGVYRLPMVAAWFLYTGEEYHRRYYLGDYIATEWAAEIIYLALFFTMRRRNGFAAIHDLATDTRVVVAAARPARPELPLPAQVPPMLVSERLGPFAVAMRAGDFVIAYDDALRRRVWIQVVPPGTPAVRPERRDLSRATRLRWLTGRRSEEENWDAYEAPAGAPLTAYLNGQQPWQRARGWLLDLAEELRLALDEGTLPDAVGFDRVWLTREGHAVLLEFPAPGTSAHPTRNLEDAAEAQAFLDEIATATLRPRMPLHAREILQTLRARRFESMALVAGNLHAAMEKPAEVIPRRRLLSFAIATYIAIAIGLVVAYAWAFMNRQFEKMWDAEYPGRTSLRLIVATNDLDLGRNEALVKATDIVLAARYRDVVEDQAFWKRIETDAVTTRAFRDRARRAVAERGEVSPEVLRAAEAILEPRLEKTRELERRLISFVGSTFAFAMLGTFGLVGCLGALLLGTPPGLRLNHLALVTCDGAPAARWRVFLRSILTWAPAFAGTGVTLYLFDTTASVAVMWTFIVSCVVIFTALAVLAIHHPERALHDFLVRTWIVPR